MYCVTELLSSGRLKELILSGFIIIILEDIPRAFLPPEKSTDRFHCKTATEMASS